MFADLHECESPKHRELLELEGVIDFSRVVAGPRHLSCCRFTTYPTVVFLVLTVPIGGPLVRYTS